MGYKYNKTIDGGTGMRKNIFLISIIIIIFIIVAFVFSNIISFGEGIALYINHGVWIPKPDKVQGIYRYDFREGEDFSIWSYSNDKFEKVISKKYFEKINENSIDKMTEKIVEYYDRLDSNEKSKFDEWVIISELINTNNYYLYKESPKDSRTFFVIIANVKENKLYYFNAVW